MVEQNFIRFYERSFRNNWELPALSDYFKEEGFTYGETAEEIARLHLVFEGLGIRKGDRIALFGRNNTRWCIAFLAVVTYGAVVVPVLQDFNANDVHHILNHSGAVLLFAGDQHWDSIVPRNVEKMRAVFSLTDFSCLYERKGSHAKKVREELDGAFRKKYPDGFSREDVKYADVPDTEVVELNYTSGTTGFSKGVMITGGNLANNIAFGIASELHFPGSRALAFLPLAHAYGCMFDFLFPLAVGTHVTLLGKIPSPKVLLEAFARVKPNIIFMVPLIIEKIYKKQILPALERKTIRFASKIPLLAEKIYEKINRKLVDSFGGAFSQVIIGGAPLNPEVEAFLYKIRFPFTVGYGMTECAPLISYMPYTEFVPTSCGRAITGMEIRIDSSDPQHIPGEIVVRGKNVMKGYYKNEAATRDVLEPDGWLHTGDMGTMGEDGTLFIRGRSKSMILTGSGQNIYPEEIESKLNNMPCVMESLVVQRKGKLVALVYPDYEDDASGSCGSVQQLSEVMERNRQQLNRLVAPYEQITEIVLYPTEFEKTPKRSIKRYLYNV